MNWNAGPALFVAAALAAAACEQPPPTVTVNNAPGAKAREGAKGRIVGYLYDAETGFGFTDASVDTYELGEKRTAKVTDGFFTLDGLTAGGSYRVNLRRDGYVPRWADVAIAQVPADAYDAVGTGSVGSVPMAKGTASVRGRVEWASGQAVTNAKVVADFTGQRLLLVASGTVGQDGTYTLDNLPAFPTGLSQSICIYAAQRDNDGVADYLPACQNVTLFPNQTAQTTHRLARYDQQNGDANAIQGFVRDGFSRLPVAGVEVFEDDRESLKVTTDSTGFYYLPSLSVNDVVRVVYRKAGYAQGFYENQTTSRGSTLTKDQFMYPADGAIDGRVYYANMVPAKNAEVRLDLRGLNFNGSSFNVFRAVRADDEGRFSLEGLPTSVDGLPVTLAFSPWSADPDAFPETANSSAGATLYPGAKTPVVAVLPTRGGFSLVANNAASGSLGVDEPVKLFFSIPADPSDSLVQLFDQTAGGLLMDAAAEYAEANRALTITPRGPAGTSVNWQDGRSYRVSVTMRPNNGAALYSTTVNFVARSSIQQSNIQGRVAFVVAEPGDVDAGTRGFSLRWPPLAEAFSYNLYARTTGTGARVPNWTRFTSVAASASPSVSFTLPTSFDIVAGQPFAFGQGVVFMVAPVDSRGLEATDRSSTLEVKDNVPPVYASGIAQLDSAASSGTARDVRLRVRANEALDRVNRPNVTAPAGWTVKSWTVDEDGTGHEGVLVLSGSGAGNVTVAVKDTSGNASRSLTVPLFTTMLLPNGSFEGSTCTTAGWTAETTQTCAACPNQALPAPAAASDVPGVMPAASGTCAATFGLLDGSYCGVQGLSAPIDLTAATLNARTITVTGRSWSASVNGNVRASCQLLDATNAASPTVVATPFSIVNNASRSWSTWSLDVTPWVGKPLRLRCQLDTQGTCTTRGVVQLDDFRVYVK